MEKQRNTRIISFVICALMFISLRCPTLAHAADNLTNYKINVTFNEETKTLRGVETVNFTNTYDKDLNDILLHLYPDSYNRSETLPAIGGMMEDAKNSLPDEQKGDIKIDKVTISDKDVSYTQDNQSLKLKLADSLKKGQSIEITINFTLKIPQGYNRLGYTENQYSLTNWYPIMSIYDSKNNKWDDNTFNPIGESNYSDVSNYDVTVNVPKGMVIAATGVNKDTKHDGNSDIVNIKAENVRDFVMMMSKNYKVVSTTVDGIKVNSFYLSSGSKDKNEATAKIMLNYSKDALQFFSKTFGKYPYPEFDIVETYLQGGAMEYPQLVQMGKYANQSGPDQWLKQAIVHETGHQWWYVTVGSNEFKEPFLDESLTEYSTAYFFEKKYGKYATGSVTMSIKSRIHPTDSMPAINRGVDAFKNWIDYGNTIYTRGSMVFEDLRTQIGDDKFQKVLQVYFDKYKLKNSSVEGFLNVVGEVAGDTVKGNIDKALNSTNYYPKNIELTSDENKQIDKEQQIKYIKEMANQNGTIVGSYVLNALNGEKVYIVKPSKLNSNEKHNVDSFIENFTSLLNRVGVTPIVKLDTALSNSEIANGNLLLIGNPSNNKIISTLNNKMPVVINKNDVTTSGIVIKNNVSGIFATQNPNNKNKVIVEYFWHGKLDNSKLFEDDIAPIKMLINVGDNINIINSIRPQG